MSWTGVIETHTLTSTLCITLVDVFRQGRPVQSPGVGLSLVPADGSDPVPTNFRVAWTAGGRIVFPALEVGTTAMTPRAYRLSLDAYGLAAPPADLDIAFPPASIEHIVRLFPVPGYAFPSHIEVIAGRVVTPAPPPSPPPAVTPGPFEVRTENALVDTRNRCLTAPPVEQADGTHVHDFSLGLGDDPWEPPLHVEVRDLAGATVAVQPVAGLTDRPVIHL